MSELEKIVPAGEFKQTCLRLLEEVRTAGLSIVITKRGKPVARVVPLGAEERRHRWPTDLATQGSMRDDLVAPAEDTEAWKVLQG